MRNFKPQGIIIIVCIIAVTIIILRLPNISKGVGESLNESRLKKLEIEKQEKQEAILQQKKNDSIKFKQEQDNIIRIKKQEQELANKYVYYYNFLNQILQINGNAETENFLILKRFNDRDSCNIYFFYKKVKINLDDEELETYNGKRLIEIKYFDEKYDWFNKYKYILPCNYKSFHNFKENKSITLEKLINLIDEFKSEYLIEK